MARDADRGPFFAETEKLRKEQERAAEREAARQLPKPPPVSVCAVCGDSRCWHVRRLYGVSVPAVPEPEPTDDGSDDPPLIVAA